MKTPIRALTALVGALVVLLLAAAPAAAHGGEGQLEITSVTREGDEVTVTAHLIYVADGHGVPDATVTVVVDDGTPVTMGPGAEEGDYQATVPAPDGAAIRVTSVDPEAVVEGVAPAATDPVPPTTEATTTTTETEMTTAPPADDEDAADTTPTPVPDDAGSDDGGTSPIVIGAIVAVVLAAVVMAVILLGKRPAKDTPDTPGPGAAA